MSKEKNQERQGKIKEFLSEYNEEKQALYQDFTNTIKQLLENLLEHYDLKKNCQIVQARRKEYDSLAKKLEKAGSLRWFDQIHHLHEIVDLAAARVIFYLEEDIERFREILFKEFFVHERKLKYKKDGYKADHVIIGLRENRLFLPEYKLYTDLRCEIQMTTVLFHAWSEVEHDVIYKEPEELDKLDPKTRDIIHKRLTKAMEAITQASYDLQSAVTLTERVLAGAQVLSPEFIENLTTSENNNEIYDDLITLHQYISTFKRNKSDVDIIDIITRVLRKATTNKVTPLMTILGEFKGKNIDDILSQCLSIIDSVKLAEPRQSLWFLLKNYPKANDKNREGIEDIINRFAQYNIGILQTQGLSVQYFLVEELSNNINQLVDFADLTPIVVICRELLNPSAQSTTFSSDSMVFHEGPLPGHKAIREIRSRTIKLLQELFPRLQTDEMRAAFIEVAYKACVWSGLRYSISAELSNIIVDNTCKVISFFINCIQQNSADLYTISAIEEQTHRIIRFHGEDKLVKIGQLKDLIANNPEYQIYRVFTQIRYRNQDSWGESIDNSDWETWIDKRINDFVLSIDESSWSSWINRLCKLPHCYPLEEFMLKLAQEKPSFALDLIEREDWDSYYQYILKGLLRSSKQDIALSKIETHINERIKLNAVAFAIDYNRVDLIERLVSAVEDVWNEEAYFIILKKLLREETTKKHQSDFIDRTLQYLNTHKRPVPSDVIWQAHSKKDLLSENTIFILYENLIYWRRLDSDALYIIDLMLRKDPERIVPLFQSRLLYKRKLSDEGDKSFYEPIPRKIELLRREIIDSQVSVLFSAAITWFDGEDVLLTHNANRLILSLFPIFNAKLADILIEYVKNGGIERASIVADLLNRYNSTSSIDPVCQQIITLFPDNESLERKLIKALTQTGVVAGEYGFVQAYSQVKDRVKDWKRIDNSPAIQSFVRKFLEVINANITFEEQRADRCIESRRREWLEDLENETDDA